MLYRYFKSHALETLESGQLMLGKISEFNDPFEFLFLPDRTPSLPDVASVLQERLKDPLFGAKVRAAFPGISDAELARIVFQPSMIQHMAGRIGAAGDSMLDSRTAFCDRFIRIGCFATSTEPAHEMLMWSHYTNGHSGWRIGFELPKQIPGVYTLDAVSYSEKRVSVSTSGSSYDAAMERNLSIALRTKSVAWSYEAEHRLVAKLSSLIERDLGSGKMAHFLPFDPAHVLRVDCGIRSDPVVNKRISELVAQQYPNAKVYTADFHSTEFNIRYNEA